MDLKGLPTDLEQFVHQEIAEGNYQSAEEVISAALRLLQDHDDRKGNGQQSSNGNADTPLLSSNDVLHAISEALETGHYNLACQLARDGARQYPEHRELRKAAHILAPPAVRNVPSSPATRTAVKANGEWLKTHRLDYLGRWVALRAGELLRVDDTYEALVADLDTTPDLLLTKIV